MTWQPLSNVLHLHDSNVKHECAIVLSLDPTLRNSVESARRESSWAAVAGDQLDPHITLLYCGVRQGSELADIIALARRFSSREVEFRLSGVGTFRDRRGRITNIHYQVTSEQVEAFHREVLEAYRLMGMDFRTPYVGSAYVPHISIFDRLTASLDSPDVRSPLPGAHRAGCCHAIGEKVPKERMSRLDLRAGRPDAAGPGS